jgi:hypothetical protein
MADEPSQPAAAPQPAPRASGAPQQPAQPVIEPTPSQVESQSFVKQLDDEIEGLWAKVEGRAPQEATEPDDAGETPPEPAKARTAPAEPVAADVAAKTDETAKPDDADPEAIRQRAYDEARAKIEAEARIKAEAEARVRAEQEYQQAVAAYTGPQADYDAVMRAARLAMAGDHSALDALDVTLPNGQKVSQVKGGEKGLTQAEASALLDSWDQARKYQQTLGDVHVQKILGYWDREVRSALADPDVDADAVTRHAEPAKQMAALRDAVRERVTKRLGEAHAAEIAAKDDEIKRLGERVTSLQNERGNLVSQARASTASSPDRPGEPGALRREIPTPDEVHRMSTEEFFKSGTNERLLQAIPGGAATRRRRAG